MIMSVLEKQEETTMKQSLNPLPGDVIFFGSLSGFWGVI